MPLEAHITIIILQAAEDWIQLKATAGVKINPLSASKAKATAVAPSAAAKPASKPAAESTAKSSSPPPTDDGGDDGDEPVPTITEEPEIEEVHIVHIFLR